MPSRMNRASVEMVPSQPPSPALFELLRWVEDSYHELQQVCAVEFTREELRGFGELSPQQVDRLLSRE